MGSSERGAAGSTAEPLERCDDGPRLSLDWHGPVDDTELFLTGSGGSDTPVVYPNGAYADLTRGRAVIAELGPDDWRHISYDERAQGRSKRSTDYSFEACLRDLDAVLDATGVERPLLAGWSYRATLAMHWARRNPGRALEVVAVEANELLGTLEPVLDSLRCPVRYVVATGGHLGADDEEMAKARATLDPVLERKPNIRVSATVPSNHAKILRREFRAVANAIRETAAGAQRQHHRHSLLEHRLDDLHSQGVLGLSPGGIAFVSGQLGIRPDATVGNGAQQQTRIAFENIARVLAEAGPRPRRCCFAADLPDLAPSHRELHPDGPWLPRRPPPAATLLVEHLANSGPARAGRSSRRRLLTNPDASRQHHPDHPAEHLGICDRPDDGYSDHAPSEHRALPGRAVVDIGLPQVGETPS